MKYIFSLVLALLAVLLIVTIVSEGIMSEGAAVVSRVEGTARLFTPGSPAGREIRNNDSIAKNDRVEVPANSRLELRLPEGGTLRLAENTRLTMRLLQFEKRTGTVNVQAFLDNGKVWTKIRNRATPGSTVEVITRTGPVTAKEAVCEVDAEKGATTTVTVYEGVLTAASTTREAAQTVGQTSAPAQAQPVILQAGQQLSVTAQGAVQQRDLDPKAAMNEWIRWNLQRDAREGLVSITLAPASSTITRGSSLQFAAVAHYPDKTEKDITSFATWSSSAVGIAKVDPSGKAAGTELGAATISAAIDDMSGSTTLNVSREILSIKVTPATGSIANGADQQFRAVGTFSDKTVKDITSSVVWRSSNTNVAFVDAGGRAVAGKVTGTALISASLGTKRGSATLKVRRELVSIAIMPATALVMAGNVQRFGAIGSYSDGTTQDLTEAVEWESSDAGIAEIDEAQPGRVIGKNKIGNATISASFDKRSGSGTLTVYKLTPP